MIFVNDVKIKTPKRMVVGIYDVSKNADRNAAGEIIIDRVATKRKLEMEWGLLHNDEIKTLLSAVTDVFFKVKYNDPQTGAQKEIQCYAGDRSAPVQRFVMGIPVWEGLKMNFIEK